MHLWVSVHRDVLVLIGAFLIAAAVLFKPWVHGADGMAYYSWLRSAVVDGDLNTANEYDHFGYSWIAGTTATGYKDNPWAIGSAVLWAPFFLIAHVITHGDGYGPAYFTAISLASTIYAFIGLLLLYRLARELFGSGPALLATIVVWFVSPLLFYMYLHPSMAHANDAFVNALFVYIWHRTRFDRKAWGWLMLGATVGLAALVRPQNGLLALIPAVELLFTLRGNLRRLFALIALNSVAFGIGLLAAFFPQMYVWHKVYDSWIVFNPYQTSAGYTFNPTSPNFINVLFSSHHGLFTWTPALLLAVVGLVPLACRDWQLAMLLAVSFIAQVYIIGGWSVWAGGAAFGQRFLVNNTPAYLLGMAALVESLRRHVGLRALCAIGVALILWNLGLVAQYVTGMIPREAPVSLATIAANQFHLPTVIASQLGELLAKRFEVWR